MEFRRPPPNLGQLLPGLADLMTRRRADENVVMERPEDTAAGAPPPLVNNDDVIPQLPVNPLHEWAFDVVLERFDLQLPDVEFDEDRDSDDSGYDSMSEDEEEEEDIRPHSPLMQEIPPAPPAPAPVDLPVGLPELAGPSDPAGPSSGPPGPPYVLQGPEECAPSTSGLGSLKRRREESSPEQVGLKRARTAGEENPEDPAPSTSGLSSGSNRRFWHHPFQSTGWSDDSDSD
ncbi:uncharacterized protein LOC141789511 [Halichoeres trimaculatus]|uniref:uncharacterized protein LOC141789511 n=1 Tax=Halichoeres trimaculatus TaxID=147232 RepID=UPI003D9F82F5